MHFFWLLVLAHFIGDFALQTDKIYFYKRTYKWGVSVHVAVCMGVKLLLVLPYLHLPKVWLILLVIAFLHILIDHGKIVLSIKYNSDNLWYFLLDQTLHLCSIIILTWLLFDFKDPQPRHFFIANLLLALDENTLILFTGLVVVTFSVAPFIYYICEYISKSQKLNETEYNFPPFKERIFGYSERLLVTLGVMLGGWYLLLFLSFVPKYFFRLSRKNLLFSYSETFIGALFCIGIGLWVKT